MQQLVEGEHDRGGGLGQLQRGAPRQGDEFVGGVGDGGGDVGERERLTGAGEGGDGPAEHGVLGRVEGPAEDAGDEGGGQRLAVDGLGRVAAVVHRVEPVGAAGVEADDRQPVARGRTGRTRLSGRGW